MGREMESINYMETRAGAADLFWIKLKSLNWPLSVWDIWFRMQNEHSLLLNEFCYTHSISMLHSTILILNIEYISFERLHLGWSSGTSCMPTFLLRCWLRGEEVRSSSGSEVRKNLIFFFPLQIIIFWCICLSKGGTNWANFVDWWPPCISRRGCTLHRG